MQKSIVALAVAGVLAASAVAQAETTLYGSARIGVEYTQGKGDGKLSAWDVANQASRLGVKGSEDLGGGLSAIYQFEFGVNIDGNGTSGTNPWGQRLSFVGLQGGFGTVALGRQYRPAYTFVSQYTDIFNGGITNPYSLTSNEQRVGNAVAYVTPTFGGFTAAVAVLMDGNGQNCKFNDIVKLEGNCNSDRSNREDIDAIEVGAGYSNGPLNIGVSYSYQPNGGFALPGTFGPDATVGTPPVTINGTGVASVDGAEFSHYGIGGSFVVGPVTVGASYEYTDFDNKDLGNLQGYGAVLGFDVTPNTTLRGTYGNYHIDSKVLGYDNQETWGLGVEHRLSKRTMLYVEYIDSETTYDASTEGAKPGTDYTTIGMRHDF